MTKDEALRLALEALETLTDCYDNNAVGIEIDAIKAIKEALETKDEPVAWRYDQAKYRTNDLRGRQWAFNVFSQTKPYIDEMVQNVTPLYTTPQSETKDEFVSMRMPKVVDRVVCIEDDIELMWKVNSADIEALEDAKFTLTAIKEADPEIWDFIIDESLVLINKALGMSYSDAMERVMNRARKNK